MYYFYVKIRLGKYHIENAILDVFWNTNNYFYI